MTGERQHVVIHAGFHKTGTTSAQAVLRRNGPKLWPVMALGLRYRLKPVLSAARGYSTWRDALSLAKFRHRFDQYLGELDLTPKRQLLVSCEELAGHLPGRGDLDDYSATPALMATLAEVLGARYGAALDLTFYFSLRQPEPWLRSAYTEHVKSSRMRLDFDAYRARYAASADLPAAAAAVREAVAPHRLVTTWLEETGTLRLGPADPLLDLMSLDGDRRAALQPQPAQNTALSDAALAECLAINRRNLSADAAHDAKQAILARPDAR